MTKLDKEWQAQASVSTQKKIIIKKLLEPLKCCICGGAPTHAVHYRDPDNLGPAITGTNSQQSTKVEHSCDKCIVQTTQLILTKIGLGI